MSHFFISGGNGFLGRHLVERLFELNVNCVISTRRKTCSTLANSCVQCHHGFDSVPDELLSGVDTVFHLANVAHTELGPEETFLYDKVNVKGTQDLLEAAVKSGVGKFVYISSVKAEGTPTDLYGQSKRDAEQVVLRYGRESDLDVVVIRPSLIYGVGVKGNIRSMITSIILQKMPWKYVGLAEFGNVRSMVAVDDVVSAMLLAAASRKANGKIYTLSDGVPYTPFKLQESIFKASGLKSPIILVPRWLLVVVARAGQAIQNLTGKSMPINQSIFDKITKSSEFNSSLIYEDLGWLPQHSFYSKLPAIIEGLSFQTE